LLVNPSQKARNIYQNVFGVVKGFLSDSMNIFAAVIAVLGTTLATEDHLLANSSLFLRL
jgi:hypothetical protein